jgi:hypothetical protein
VFKSKIRELVSDLKIVSRTQEMVYHMLGVSAMQFFNTALILFFISFDVNTLTLRKEWYTQHVGTIYFAMVFTAAWPILEIACIGFAFKAIRYWDRGFTSNKYITRMKST